MCNAHAIGHLHKNRTTSNRPLRLRQLHLAFSHRNLNPLMPPQNHLRKRCAENAPGKPACHLPVAHWPPAALRGSIASSDSSSRRANTLASIHAGFTSTRSGAISVAALFKCRHPATFHRNHAIIPWSHLAPPAELIDPPHWSVRRPAHIKHGRPTRSTSPPSIVAGRSPADTKVAGTPRQHCRHGRCFRPP